jgi:hypothetical protein
VTHNESETDPVIVENASFTWDDNTNGTTILKNINMRVSVTSGLME